MNLRASVAAMVVLLCGCGIIVASQTQTAQNPKEQAWSVLNSGLTNSNIDKRKKAVGELGSLPGDSQALDAALTALKDEKPEVRTAAAQALGEMSAKTARPQLLAALHDSDVGVILTAAHSLVLLGDERGYDVFYAVLTGQQKSSESLMEQQKKLLNNPKKLAGIGFQAGLGFVPFGSLGYSAFKFLTKDDASPVLAAAALTLAKDPDPKSGEALANAALEQKKWLVRAAAFDAIAKRGDPSLKGAAVSGLQDAQEQVQYSAAAAVIRLSDIEEHPQAKPSPVRHKTPPKK
ncbi:MAG: HEAT repeat domain-containing protein [Candidatus Korobacteraceae bacterium]